MILTYKAVEFTLSLCDMIPRSSPGLISRYVGPVLSFKLTLVICMTNVFRNSLFSA